MDLLLPKLIPFLPDGALDEATFLGGIARLRALGVRAFAPGLDEVTLLSPDEQLRVAELGREACAGVRWLPVFAAQDAPGREALLRRAAELGPPAVVVVPPGLPGLSAEARRHLVLSAADAAGAPVYLPAAPRSPALPHLDLCLELYVEGSLAGLIDTSEDLQRVARLAEALPHALFASGDLLLGHLLPVNGLEGGVSALAELRPQQALDLSRGRPEDKAWRRAARAARHGGLAALKAALGLGMRPPLHLPDPAAVRALGASGLQRPDAPGP